MSQTTTSAKLRLICALKSVDNFFGGQDLGISSENVSMQLVDMRASDQESYIGFFIDFSFPTSGEDNGFVKCDLTVLFMMRLMNNGDTYGGASDEDTTKCLKIECPTSWSDVKLVNGARASVEGFGTPYANPGPRSSQVSLFGPHHR
uniref:Uncharacterized protein n=1 Tax=Fusarium oxysporum (strain Fo5176) TaxID=660025 RepID=A0A0D2XXS9_FUSOF